MEFQENIPLAPKTTLKIGGNARYYAELQTKEDVEEAHCFAKEKNLPLIVLGAGSNTIFADGTIEALVVKVVADEISLFSSEAAAESRDITIHSGKYLAPLINELAEQDLDLSALTGIPGTVGGALFGNAGQGFGGTWTDSFVESVEVFIDGEWKTMTKDECKFGYRQSIFKASYRTPSSELRAPFVIWSTTLKIPTRPKEEVEAEISRLLKRRIETQPHRKTAGSCFLSKNKENPAWKLIDAKGLRGHTEGGMKVSEKHANFLIHEKDATFADAKKLVNKIKNDVDEDLQVEMRFIEQNGSLAF